MPTVRVNGADIFYREHGSGPETIVFSHGLLLNHEMFHAQVETLSTRYRCIAYDHRGQGRSEITASGYDMDNVAQDAAALIEALNAAPCHFAGLSMGGFVGMRLAIKRPELLKSLVLLETSADPEPNVRPYRVLAFIGRWFGFRPVIKRLLNILFGRTFMADPQREEERAKWRNHLLGANRTGVIRAAHGVIDREGVYEQLGDIALPTLVIVGEEDTATKPNRAQRIHAAVPNSRLALIPGAGHSSTIEAPTSVTNAIADFLET